MCGEFDCYGLGGDFPDGLDYAVYSFSAIENAWRNAELNSEREHVGPYIENNPQLFKNGSLKILKDYQIIDGHLMKKMITNY